MLDFKKKTHLNVVAVPSGVVTSKKVVILVLHGTTVRFNRVVRIEFVNSYRFVKNNTY